MREAGGGEATGVSNANQAKGPRIRVGWGGNEGGEGEGGKGEGACREGAESVDSGMAEPGKERGRGPRREEENSARGGSLSGRSKGPTEGFEKSGALKGGESKGATRPAG